MLRDSWYDVIVTVVLTAGLLAVWIDTLRDAMRVWTHHPSREALHNVVGIAMTIVVAAGTGVAQVAEVTPPPPVDDLNLLAISTVRVVLLVVGIWMAWDRRVARKKERRHR